MVHQALISAIAALDLFASAVHVPALAGAIQGNIEMSSPSQDVTVERFERTRTNGTPVWGATASYELSTGDIAEIYMEIDGSGFGEFTIAINGEPIVVTRYDSQASGEEPALASWISPTIDYAPEVLVELMEAAEEKDVLHQMIPEKFPCSDFGQKALKAGKYIFLGATGAFIGTCCATGVGCGVCSLAGTALGAAGADALDNYCD